MSARPSPLARWFHDRSLTLTMLGLFAVCAVGQVLAGWLDVNQTAASHGEPPLALGAYVTRGHLWEALFENWESEFLQMAAFVMLTAVPLSEGLARIAATAARTSWSTPTRARMRTPDAPWPVPRGGWVLRVYEHSLGLALCPVVRGLVRRPRARRLGRVPREQQRARAAEPRVVEYSHVEPLLVRVASELAERVPVASARWCG